MPKHWNKRAFKWHRCDRWWKRQLQCPYDGPGENLKPDEKDDTPDEDLSPLPPPIEVFPGERKAPTIKKGKELRAPQWEGFKDLWPEPDVPGGLPFPLPPPPLIPIPGRREREEDEPVPHRPGTVPYPAYNAERWEINPADRSWSLLPPKSGTVPDLDEAPSGGTPLPYKQPTPQAVAENALAQAYQQRSNERSGRSRSTYQPVDEGERSPRGAKPRNQPLWDYKGIADRQNRETDRNRALTAGRVGAAIAAAAGTAYVASKIIGGGGRGGGFHKPALTFRPGDKAFRTAF